jgi:hypothetical protein
LIPRRECPTCRNPIDRGPGQHAYCSDECRPTCAFDGCTKPTRGRNDLCNMHYAQSLRGDELKPSQWSEREPICLVCKANPTAKNMRRYCSDACKRIAQKHSRPTHYNCARCEVEVSLVEFASKERYRKSHQRRRRADSALCDSCKRRPRWSPLSARELANRDGPNCGICRYPVDFGAERTDEFRPSIDHIIPRSHGGSDDAENLQLAHLWCNQIKNARIGPTGWGPQRMKFVAERFEEVNSVV